MGDHAGEPNSSTRGGIGKRAAGSAFFRPGRRGNGFTLMELVMVMVITAIFAGIVLPKAPDTKAINDGQRLRELRSAVGYAQKAGIAARRVVYAQYNPGTSSLDFCWTAACPHGGAAAPLTEPSGGSLSFTAPSGTVFSASSFSFDANGTPSFGAPLALTLGAGTFTVEAGTGFVH